MSEPESIMFLDKSGAAHWSLPQGILCRTCNGAPLCRRGCIAHAFPVGHSQGLVGGKAYACACYAAAQAHAEALVQPRDALCPDIVKHILHGIGSQPSLWQGKRLTDGKAHAGACMTAAFGHAEALVQPWAALHASRAAITRAHRSLCFRNAVMGHRSQGSGPEKCCTCAVQQAWDTTLHVGGHRLYAGTVAFISGARDTVHRDSAKFIPASAGGNKRITGCMQAP